MKPSLTIPVAVIIGGLIVAGAVYVTVKPPATRIGDAGSYRGELVRPVDSSDHILGNPAASIKIIEYSDFDCQYCKQFDTTLRQLIAAEGADGDVAWVYRQFPLSELHPNALSHARAAECVALAAGNDAFWKFAGELFANQPTQPSRYGELASAAGVTGDAFSACYADTKTVDARIKADRDNALAMGAKGTPFTVIVSPGRAPVVIDGASSYDALRQFIDELQGEAPVAP